MSGEIRALETSYAGCRFRSRLEARWAVFFDALGFRWEYEPEGFALPSGNYLPDFRLSLSKGAVWFEVKPPLDGSRDRYPPSYSRWPRDSRWPELAQTTGMNLYVAHGMARYVGKQFLRPDIQVYLSQQYPREYNGQGSHDAGYCFCVCAMCFANGLEYDETAGRLCSCWGDDEYGSQHYSVEDAYRKAISARFEWGEP